MNNKFDIFVKKTKSKVKLRLLCPTLIIALLVIVEVIFKIDSNIFVPLILNSEYLVKLSNELSNKIEIPSNIDNLVNYVQCMINNNQMIFVEKKFKLNTIVDLINNMM